MLWIILGSLISIIGAYFTFDEKKIENKSSGKSNGNNLRNTILICIGISISLLSGVISQHESKIAEKRADSLSTIAAKRENQIIQLQMLQLDTTARILKNSLATSKLQSEISKLQNQLFEEVTGGDSIIKIFNLSVVTDSSYFPIRFDNDKLTLKGPFLAYRYLQVQTIAYPVFSSGDHPKTLFDALGFYAKLIQFKLLRDVIDFHSHPSMSWSDYHIHTETYVPPSTLKYEVVNLKNVRKIFSENKFAIDANLQELNGSITKLPIGIKITYLLDGIRLEKHGEFCADIKLKTVVSLGSSMPENVDITNANINNYHSMEIAVGLEARFFGNDIVLKSKNRKWVYWVFNHLERINAD